MTAGRVAALILCGCGAAPRAPAPAPAAASAPAPAADPKLPEGVHVPRASDVGDFDADGRLDRILVVEGATEVSDRDRGLAIVWGSGAETTVIGVGHPLAVIEFGDTDATTTRAEGTPSKIDDLSFLMAWDVLDAVPGPRGHKVLRGRAPAHGPMPRTFDFLPEVHGDAIRVDGGDAAWVIYRTARNEWFYAPLGY